MTTELTFADKYRPQTFAEVFGQDSAVTCLSGLITRGQIGRHILLHGAVGSGKTTLAKIYARALNCAAPEADGSPCRDRCAACQTGTGKQMAGFHEYNVSRNGGSLQEVGDWVGQLNREEREHKHRILFFDEAQALTPRACDALLGAVEAPAPRVLFFFATTEAEKIRPALRSRLFDLLIRPLSARDAVTFLHQRAEAETLDVEPGALELLAGLRSGYPRNLLLGLDRVYERGRRLTVEQVRAAFDVDQTEILVAYFGALADGDLARQTDLVFTWRESLPDKIRWIQAFLISLYHNNILHRRLVVDGVIEAIPESMRGPILDRFCRRLGLARRADLEPIWCRLMEFWPVPETATDETALSLRVTLFHHLVNGAAADGARGDQGSDDSAQASLATPPSAASSPSAWTPATPPASDWPHAASNGAAQAADGSEEPGFLSAADVRRIVNAASFLMQEHGVLFNAALTISPALCGMEGRAAAALIAAFRDDLTAQAAAWGGALFASLTVIEHEPHGLVGRLVAHLPLLQGSDPERADGLERVTTWVHAWCVRNADAVRDAVYLTTAPTDAATALKFHWVETLDLCAGLSPSIVAWDPQTEARTPLLDRLAVRPRETRRVVDAPLVSVSDRLSEAAMADASRNGLAPLSAFDDGAWAWIRRGWERDEYRERRATRSERATERDRLCQRLSGGTPGAEAAIDALVATWPVDPHARRRRWSGW